MCKDISLANLTCKYFCGEKPLANPTCKYFCGDTSRGKPQGNSFFFGKSGGQTGLQTSGTPVGHNWKTGTQLEHR